MKPSEYSVLGLLGAWSLGYLLHEIQGSPGSHCKIIMEAWGGLCVEYIEFICILSNFSVNLNSKIKGLFKIIQITWGSGRSADL